jgi:transposase InsO family protein
MIPQNVKDYFRRGEKYWKDHYLPYLPTDYSEYYGMQMSVYDHKTFDMACRIQNPDGTWKRIRPYLTMITDQRSRLIQGWCIDETPSVVTLLRAERMKVEKYGCSEQAKMDNGRDMRSNWFTGDAWEKQHGMKTDEQTHFSSIMGDLGTASHFTLAYHGQAKNIERNFGFIASEFDKSFDSYLGSNTSDRHDESRRYVGSFEGAGKVPIEELPTLDEVRELFAKYAEWFNTKWKHSGNGMNSRTPIQVFNETKHSRRDPILDSKYIWTRRMVKKASRIGITDNEIHYYNEAMSAGTDYELRISIDDVNTAYVFSLEGEYLFDAVSDFKATGVREEDIRQVNKQRKAQRKKLEEYKDLIKEQSKDKLTQLEELRAAKSQNAKTGMIFDAEGGNTISLEMLKVSGGEPLAKIQPQTQKRKILLPTDPGVELLYAEV